MQNVLRSLLCFLDNSTDPHIGVVSEKCSLHFVSIYFLRSPYLLYCTDINMSRESSSSSLYNTLEVVQALLSAIQVQTHNARQENPTFIQLHFFAHKCSFCFHSVVKFDDPPQTTTFCNCLIIWTFLCKIGLVGGFLHRKTCTS